MTKDCANPLPQKSPWGGCGVTFLDPSREQERHRKLKIPQSRGVRKPARMLPLSHPRGLVPSASHLVGGL